jgi:ribosome-binding factor A
METTRQLKVSRLIQKELSEVILREGRWIVGKSMVSVTSVRVSPDLSVAKVFLSIFGPGTKEETITSMNAGKSRIRLELGKKLRNQVRIVPELIFYLDDSVDYFANIEKLLKKGKGGDHEKSGT